MNLSYFTALLNISSGKEKEVLAMENGGNQKVNAIFEAHLNVAKPNNSASGPVRERFIRDKYERRKFYDPSAFESAAQTNNGHNGEEEEELVIAGVQRRLASERGAGTPSSSRKPSDAARKRVEERASRNRFAGGDVGVSSASTRIKPTNAPVAEAPASVADLLDFGDFNSIEAASSFGRTAAPTVVASVATPAPAVDMFANFTSHPVAQQPLSPPKQQPEKKTMSNADIMSMFNTPNPQHNPMQQNMFPMQNGMIGGMGGGSNMMMNPNNNMGLINQHPIGVNNMGMSGNMNQMMMMQNGMGKMHQQQMGMNNNMNMMGGHMNQMSTNPMMMMQPQPQNQMHQMNMMGGNMMQGFGMMQGSNQFGSPMGQSQQQHQRGGGSTADQFADFGNFGR